MKFFVLFSIALASGVVILMQKVWGQSSFG